MLVNNNWLDTCYSTKIRTKYIGGGWYVFLLTANIIIHNYYKTNWKHFFQTNYDLCGYAQKYKM